MPIKQNIAYLDGLVFEVQVGQNTPVRRVIKLISCCIIDPSVLRRIGDALPIVLRAETGGV